jgi:hypothetical protein
MTLREDSEPYCIAWLGILLLSSYYFNFAYQIMTGIALHEGAFLLMLLPIASIWFFYRFLKFDRSRTKMTMLSIGGFMAVFYLIIMWFYSTPLSDTAFLSSWAFGSVLLIAGGFAMFTSPEYTEEAKTPGIMDTSKLHYGPPLEEPEPEEETPTEETVVAEETTSAEDEPTPEVEKEETEEPSAVSEETAE